MTWDERRLQIAELDGDAWSKAADAYAADWIAAYSAELVRFAVERGWSRAHAESWLPGTAQEAFAERADKNGWHPIATARADVPDLLDIGLADSTVPPAIGLKLVATTSDGTNLYCQPNGAGGHTYWSDATGDGVRVWDTCLTSVEELRLAMAAESDRPKAERVGGCRGEVG